MVWTDETINTIGYPLRSAVFNGDCAAISQIVEANPWVISDHDWTGSVTWIGDAATFGHARVVELLLDLGFNINALADGKHSALIKAIRCEHDEIVQILLSRGADPNPDRTLIAAMNSKATERRMRYVRLLVEHGIDVNQRFMMFGDPNRQMTALDWAQSHPEIAAYLREHGAKTAAELKAP